jgi:hypothetical protein
MAKEMLAKQRGQEQQEPSQPKSGTRPAEGVARRAAEVLPQGDRWQSSDQQQRRRVLKVVGQTAQA